MNIAVMPALSYFIVYQYILFKKIFIKQPYIC